MTEFKFGDTVRLKGTMYVGQVNEIDSYEGVVYAEFHQLGQITVIPSDLTTETEVTPALCDECGEEQVYDGACMVCGLPVETVLGESPDPNWMNP